MCILTYSSCFSTIKNIVNVNKYMKQQYMLLIHTITKHEQLQVCIYNLITLYTQVQPMPWPFQYISI